MVGFTAIEQRPFVRATAPNATRPAVLFDWDVLGTGATDKATGDRRPAVLRQYERAGWLLFAHAWRPQVAQGLAPDAAVRAELAALGAALGVELHTAHCPHEGGPPICWCRKPIPGLVLAFARQYGVALDRGVAVGRSPADRTMAQRLGVPFRDVAECFGPDP